jgi:formate-dependent nitrite reductase membrane component NrfD
VQKEKEFMSFGIYIIGFLILIGGLIYAAVMLHVPSQWIAVGGIVLTGLGILTGVKATRQKDPA